MLRRLHIENFKSIEQLDFEPGRFNVLIGENGSGKSNVLEALAFAGAAAGDKLDHEFLKSRGLRVSDGKFMRSAFAPEKRPIRLVFEGGSGEHEMSVTEEEGSTYPRWKVGHNLPPEEVRAAIDRVGSDPEVVNPLFDVPQELLDSLTRGVLGHLRESFAEKGLPLSEQQALTQAVRRGAASVLSAIHERVSKQRAEAIASYVVYSPEASALRTFEREGQIVPLGVAGEGLFKLLQVLAADEKDPSRFAELKENLRLLDWFESIEVPPATGGIQEQSVRLRDRFIPEEMGYFDQRSANEAFLFILFYLALFVSADTPRLFGIDNIDASLNPKTCRELTRRLTKLAKTYDKQVVVTTHNPAVLDGLDLNDDEQRLFVVRRGRKGDTKLRRVSPPQPVAGEPPIKLSEAFLRGLLGGLPQNF
jgi:predicted ATPase